MITFGWDYPPGCNSVPGDEPDGHPASELAWEILEAAGVDECVIEQITEIIDNLAIDADRECPACLARWAQEEQREQ